MESLLSPRQAASMVGLSESTVRRWCDRRQVSFQLTKGGHRRLLRSSVIEHARRLGLALDEAGEPASLTVDTVSLSGQLFQLLADGRHVDGQRLVLELLAQGASPSRVCDEVVAPAMCRIGDAWEAGRLDIFQEHAASQAIAAALGAAQLALAKPLPGSPVVICAALQGDPYVLGPMMAGLVLQSEGCRPWITGSNMPASQVLAAVDDTDAKLVTISVGCVEDHPRLVSEIHGLFETLTSRGCQLAVGGRALERELRTQLSADFFGDTMAHLTTFARRQVVGRHLTHLQETS